jgi:hypothetical protein
VKRLRAIDPKCRPKGWVGTITAVEIKALEGKEVTPATKDKSESTRESNEHRARWGVIYFDGTAKSASWTIEHKVTMDYTGGGLVGCTGGLRRAPPDRHEMVVDHKETSGTGSGTDVPQVDIDLTVDGRYYELSFRLPQVEGEFEGKSHWKRTGGCKDDGGGLSMPKAPWDYSVSEPLNFKGSVDPKARSISGSEMKDLMPFMPQVPGITRNEHKIRVTWHLHRVD